MGRERKCGSGKGEGGRGRRVTERKEEGEGKVKGLTGSSFSLL